MAYLLLNSSIDGATRPDPDRLSEMSRRKEQKSGDLQFLKER